MNGHEDWRVRVQSVTNPPTTEVVNPLIRTIEEFVDELNQSPWIHAELRPGGHPQVRTLLTGPKVRRDVSSLMLSFWVERDGVRIVGAREQLLRTKDEVLAYLVDFATESEFPRTVWEYRSICESDTPGELRGTPPGEGPAEINIIVPPAEQKNLAEKFWTGKDVAFDITFRVEHPDDTARALRLPGNSRLESGGFSMRVMGLRDMGGDVLRAHGDLLAP